MRGFGWWRGWGLVALGLALSSWTHAADCQLRIRWTHDPPFSMALPDGRPGGLQVELAEATFGRMGCKLLWRQLPWARALKDLESGELDVLMGAFRRPEREAYAWFSVPNRTSRNLLFVRSDEASRWTIHSWETLQRSGMRLGVQVDVSYAQELDALMREPAFRERVVRAPNRSGLWRMLQRGRIDGVVADEWTAQIEWEHVGGGTTIQSLPLVISNQPVGDAFSKRTQSLQFVQRYDQTVEGLQREGVFQAILRKYLATP
ncbi:substrate-binding periplasmic protein [Inhella gelatinilytica]|uniref:Amino acid ABC transporter substrate-binding protein n=1 Tax=Inhella gelatinilytica TaxID=2795030 RepID=A0A931NFH2_9BURK|nr:transporter substrate-binding domain-containing protein [Inhella gelatinilytica]MBH9554240.1 amino acid ABC transporter substrate-binding protein [Inhella gelatinilytica]